MITYDTYECQDYLKNKGKLLPEHKKSGTIFHYYVDAEVLAEDKKSVGCFRRELRSAFFLHIHIHFHFGIFRKDVGAEQGELKWQSSGKKHHGKRNGTTC